MGWPGGLVEGARASHKVYGAPPSTTLLQAHSASRRETENSQGRNSRTSTRRLLNFRHRSARAVARAESRRAVLTGTGTVVGVVCHLPVRQVRTSVNLPNTVILSPQHLPLPRKGPPRSNRAAPREAWGLPQSASFRLVSDAGRSSRTSSEVTRLPRPPPSPGHHS